MISAAFLSPFSSGHFTEVLPRMPTIRPVPLVLSPESANISYPIIDLIKAGTTATIVKVKTENGAEFAVKIYRQQCLKKPCEESLREWQIYKMVKGAPHVLKAHCEIALGDFYFTNQGVSHSHAIVTSLLPTPNKGAFQAGAIINMGMQALETLSYFQGKNLVHLDIKPEHMVYDESGELTIFGFKFAHKIDEIDPKLPLGTPSYWSPEQMLAKKYNGSVDVWSLGATLFKLYTGESLIPLGKSKNPTQMVIDYFWSLIKNFGPLPKEFIIPNDYRCLFKADRSIAYPPTEEITSALKSISEICRRYPNMLPWKARICFASLQKEETLHDTKGLITFLESMFVLENRPSPKEVLQRFSVVLTPLNKEGRYIVKGKLGSGGFGVVLEALTPKFKDRVAVKIHRPTVECWKESLKEEAILRALKDAPHVIHYQDSFDLSHLYFEDPDGVHFYPEAKNVYTHAILTNVLSSPNTYKKFIEPTQGGVTELSTTEIFTMAKHGLEALCYMHERKIVHQDLKPENMIYTEKEGLTLIDLGCAQWIDKIVGVEGTMNYRSPEKMLFMPHGAAADIWAFAASLFQLYVGYPLLALPQSDTFNQITIDYLWLFTQNFGYFSPTFLASIPVEHRLLFNKDGSLVFGPSDKTSEVFNYFKPMAAQYWPWPLWQIRLYEAAKKKGEDLNDVDRLIQFLHPMFYVEHRISAEEALLRIDMVQNFVFARSYDAPK